MDAWLRRVAGYANQGMHSRCSGGMVLRSFARSELHSRATCFLSTSELPQIRPKLPLGRDLPTIICNRVQKHVFLSMLVRKVATSTNRLFILWRRAHLDSSIIRRERNDWVPLVQIRASPLCCGETTINRLHTKTTWLDSPYLPLQHADKLTVRPQVRLPIRVILSEWALYY